MNQVNQVTKLHNRHLAKIMDTLRDIQANKTTQDLIRKHLSFYTNDIKNQVLNQDTKENKKCTTTSFQ